MLARFLAHLLASPWTARRRRRAERDFGKARALAEAGDDQRARSLLERIVERLPEHASAWQALGDLRLRLGDAEKAAFCYRAAMDAGLADGAAYQRLGRALAAGGRMDEAIGALRRAVEQSAGSFDALRELVLALIRADNVRKAAQLAEEAAGAHPDLYDAQFLAAFAWQKRHDAGRALERYAAALRLRADDPELYDARGSLFQELGRIDDALADYERALALRPDHASALFHRGLARLLLGEFAGGWEGYELRRLNAERPARGTRFPLWDGRALDGKTLLVRREQGLGDEIMFASMLPELASQAKHCLLECDPRLRPLFARSFPGVTVFGSLPDGTVPARLASQAIDFEIDAGSAARFLRPDAARFPRHAGYLRADPRRIEAWRRRLRDGNAGPAIGISWTGGVRKTRAALRSLPLAELVPLLEIPGLRFVSLQYTPEAPAEIGALRDAGGPRIEHWQEAIDDYEETAALVSALDLVVSVCTSVVHLAGALGRPAWVLAPYAPEWRYGFRGESMPWYPSVRIFRQPAYGAWPAAVSSVADELRKLAGSAVPA